MVEKLTQLKVTEEELPELTVLMTMVWLRWWRLRIRRLWR